MLVVDGSESINNLDAGRVPSSFRILQDSLIRITRQFSISRDTVLMGLIQFSTGSVTEVPLGGIDNGDDMATAIDSLLYQEGLGTQTTLALDAAAQELKTAGRPGVAKQIILLTDGSPDDPTAAATTAMDIKADNISITVISINVGSSFVLTRISSTGAVIEAGDVSALNGLVEQIIETTCPGT